MEVFVPVIFFVLVLSIVVLGSYFSAKKRLLRELKKSEPVPILRVQEKEYAKIIGKAKYVKEPLIAPISGRQCVFFQIRVDQKGSKNRWHNLIDQTRTEDFFLETNGEMAVVNVNDSAQFRKIVLDKDYKTTSGVFKEITPKLKSYLEEHGRKGTGIFGFNRSLRYREGIIGLDEVIAVKGVGQWKGLREPIEGFPYSKILALSGKKGQKLLITDLKKALQKKK